MLWATCLTVLAIVELALGPSCKYTVGTVPPAAQPLVSLTDLGEAQHSLDFETDLHRHGSDVWLEESGF